MNALTQKLRVIMIARNVFVSTIYNLPRPTAGVKVNKTSFKRQEIWLFLKEYFYILMKKIILTILIYVEIIETHQHLIHFNCDKLSNFINRVNWINVKLMAWTGQLVDNWVNNASSLSWKEHERGLDNDILDHKHFIKRVLYTYIGNH